MSQTWALSQDANKANGVCSVCLATRQLHHRDGTVHRHGRRDSPCPGSNKLPLKANQQPVLGSASLSSASPSAVSNPNPSQLPNQSSCTWSPGNLSFIKHIPKSARATCASHLASALRSIVSDPSSVTNWTALFNWAGSILQPPKRGGKRHNLTATIKNRISCFSSTASPGASVDSSQAKRHLANGDAKLSQAISAKLEEGNVRAAVRLLMSDDSPVEPSSDALAKLQEKHPRATVKVEDLPPSSQVQSLSVDESDVRRAVLSFPAGSAGGPDGLRPQHIRDLLLCREAGSDFLTALTAFVNMVLAGRCPSDVAPVFFGGRLLALNKKSGGIRPIAIGFTLRRVVSKCANFFGTNQLKSYFHPPCTLR